MTPAAYELIGFAVAAGIIAGLASLPFLRPRLSGVVLVSVTALYFPAWFWWVLGLYTFTFPDLSSFPWCPT